MSGRTPWNQYEAVLLVDTYIQIRDGAVSKAIAVDQLSKKLRAYGALIGVDVDDVYRNINGVNMRLAEIDRLFNEGKGGLKNTSKLFIETVALYQERRTQFNEVLTEAKRMMNQNNSNKESFVEWLKSQAKLKALPERIVTLLNEGSDYAVKHKISKESFWNINDPKAFDFACRRLLGTHLFRVLHRSTAIALDKTYVYYKNFLSEKASEYAVPSKPIDETGACEAVDTTSSPTQIEEKTSKDDVIQNELTYNFVKPQSLKFTKPISLKYFEETEIKADSWRQLLVNFLNVLFDDYSETLIDLKRKIYAGANLPLIADDNSVVNMRAPKEFVPGLYVETNRSANDIMSNVKRILDACNVDYENVVVIYTCKQKAPVKEAQPQSCSSARENQDANKKIRIIDAVSIVLQKAEKPLSAEEIYNKIIYENLYSFGAQNPVHVVDVKINAACKGTGYSYRSPEEIFGFIRDAGQKKYYLLSREAEMTKALEKKSNPENSNSPDIRTKTDAILAEKYPVLFKRIYTAMTEYSNISVSAETVLDKVGRIARLSTVKHVLDYASWSEHTGSNYKFSSTIIHYTLPDAQTESESVISVENKFYHWLESSQNLSSTDCSRYTSGIHVISQFIKNECHAIVDVYAIQDLKTVSDYFEIVKNHPKFNVLAQNQRERLNNSIRLYSSFLSTHEEIPKPESIDAGIKVETEVSNEPQPISMLLAYMKSFNDGVSFNDIRAKYPGIKPGALKAMLNTDTAVLMNGKYYHKGNIEDFEETADIILTTIQGQFLRNDGYTSAKMLYDELHVRLEDFFFDNGGFDSQVELYDLAKHLFEKVKYKGHAYIFAENKHIWETEPTYIKTYLGILAHYAKLQNNIITRDEMMEKLTDMGSTSERATFSYLMLNENQNPAEKLFLMFDEYKYVLTEACRIDEVFMSNLQRSLEELFDGDDYLSFDEIDDFFYTTLPELPNGVIWSPHMIKSILAFFDVGFFTVAVGGDNDIKIPDAAIVRKNSNYKTFSDVLWSEINKDYELPREFSAEDFREILIRKGFIHEREKQYNVHTTVEGDLRYFWTDNNGKVTVSKK